MPPLEMEAVRESTARWLRVYLKEMFWADICTNLISNVNLHLSL